MNKPLKRGRLLICATLFLLLIFATFYLLFRNQSITELWEVVSGAKTVFVIAAACAAFGFIALGGVNIAGCLKLIGKKPNAANAAKYALAGFFFSSITPSASGGQPMQLYYMYKDGIGAADGTLALLLEFLSYQCAAVSLALAGLLLTAFGVLTLSGELKYLLLIGVALNLCTLVLSLLAIFSKKATDALLHIADKLFHALKLKRADALTKKLSEQTACYRQSAAMIKANIRKTPRLYAVSLLQLLCLHSVPAFIYLAFGLFGESMAGIIALQAILYISVSALPLPGAVGASESGFVVLYKTLFGSELVRGAMLLSRGASFYLPVVVSALLLFNLVIFSKKRKIALKECAGVVE